MINPCLLGGIFKATGNVAPGVAFAAVKGKLDYEMLEIRRFIAKHGIDKFRFNPNFPVNTLMLMRGFVAAREAGVEAAYLEMGLKGLWEEGLKLDDPEILARRIDSAGLNSASLLAAAQTDRVKLKLADNTAAAVARGVFGVPTFFVGDDMFFGKDRLAQVEEAAQAPFTSVIRASTRAATAPARGLDRRVISAFEIGTKLRISEQSRPATGGR